MVNFNDFIADLKTLISFKSVADEKTKDYPFGEQIYAALNFFLTRAKQMGFQTINYDNHAGEVRFGQGEEVGIIGHLDVVPTGIGWDSDPFALTEKDDVYYARGILDDKTSPLLCLYILKELKDSGVKMDRTFRLFVGCDEESGWRDVNYLKTKTVMPEYGFSPDGNFPLSYAEKGITEVKFTLKKLNRFKSLNGGRALNVVCDYACAVADDQAIDKKLLKKYNLSLSKGNLIESFGKAAHGSTPHLGTNAIKPLLQYMSDMGEDVKDALSLFFKDGVLPGFSNEQGDVTLSPNLLSEENGNYTLTCDCRIPAPLSIEALLAFFSSFNLAFTTSERHPPMMAEKDGWFVSALLSAHDSVMQTKSKPFSMGGSTFARAFKKGCAFGPAFSSEKGNIHDANEYLSKKDLLLGYDIYKKAIFNLAKK